MQPSFLNRLFTGLHLAIINRRSELVVVSVALLLGVVFVAVFFSVRVLRAPVGSPSTAGEPTPTPDRSFTTPKPTAEASSEESFGGLQLTPVPMPTLPPTPTVTPTTIPTSTLAPTLNPLLSEPTATVTPTSAATPALTLTPIPIATVTPAASTTATPTPTPRLNPWADYIP